MSYEVCVGHARFVTKAKAKAAVKDHQRRYPDCEKCVSGLHLKAFACDVVDHWHIGHLWRE